MFGRNRSSSPTIEKMRADDDAKYLHGLQLWLLFTALSLVSILVALYMTVISTATPLITTHFGTIGDVDWYSTAYLLTICSLQPLTGNIYNLFPAKATFISFLSIFASGNLIGALAKSSDMFISGRAIAGIGAAGMFTGSMVIFTAAASPSIRPQLFSISFAMIGVGSIIGPVLGGAVTEHLGWRWCLWIFLPPVGAIILVFFLLPIAEHTPKGSALTTIRHLYHKLDIPGFVLFSGACIMLLFAFSWGGSRFTWDSATIIGLLVGGPLTIALLCAWLHLRKDRALIPLTLLAKPIMYYGCIVSLLQGASYLQVAYYLPLWFQSVKGASPQKGGIMLLPTCIAQIVSSIVCSVLVKKIPYAPVWAMLGTTFMAVGSGLLATLSDSSSPGQWIGYQIFGGAGRGLSVQMPIIAIQGILSPKEIPIATANIFFFQYFAGALANCIAKTIFVNALGPALHQYAPNVDAQAVIHSGATEVIRLASTADRAGLIEAYNKALTLTFWLPCATAILGTFFCFGLGWHKISAKKGPNKGDEFLQDKNVEGAAEKEPDAEISSTKT